MFCEYSLKGCRFPARPFPRSGGLRLRAGEAGGARGASGAPQCGKCALAHPLGGGDGAASNPNNANGRMEDEEERAVDSDALRRHYREFLSK